MSLVSCAGESHAAEIETRTALPLLESLPTRRHSRALFGITIDKREPPHTAWKFGEDVVVTRATMATSDYSPTGHETTCAVERKALGDLVACCTWERPRFIRELERFASFDFRAIVVEASLEDVARKTYRANVHPSAVVGSVVAFHVDYGIPTIWAGSPAAAARIVERIFRRYVEKRTAVAT